MGNLAVIDNEYAATVTQQSRTSFYYSFSLLPRDERQAMHSVYAFCRYADDIVDEDDTLESESQPAAPEQRIARKRERLNRLRAEVERCYNGESRHSITRSLSAVVKRFNIPKQYFLTLLDGVEMDLVKNRYETFEELREYCYSVASVVGLICIEIFGYKYEETKEYAVNLGIALQLTNILRDVRSDAERGRIYLPESELARFQVSPEEILRYEYSERYQELAKSVAARARHFYRLARETLPAADRPSMVAAELMGSVYWQLLCKLEQQRFQVFGPELTRLSKPHKIALILRSWCRHFTGARTSSYGG